MVQLLPMSGGGGVVRLPADNSDLINLQLLQQALGSVGDVGQLVAQQAQGQALADALRGTPGKPATTPGGAVQLPGNTLDTQGGIAFKPGTPATPALLPANLLPVAQQLARSGNFDAALKMVDDYQAQQLRQQQLDLERQKLSIPEPPKTRDILIGNERVFQQFDPGTGQYVEVGRGPAFAPPTSITIGDSQVPASAVTAQAAAPAAIQNVSRIGQALINPETGAVDPTLLAQFNVPVYGGSIPGTRGSQLRSVFDETISTLMYLRTGKAATSEERASFAAQYMPSPLDSAATVQDKLARLDRAIRDELEVSSRGLPGASQAPAVPAIPQASSEPGLIDRAIQFGSDLIGRTELPAPGAGSTASSSQPPAVVVPGLPSLDQLSAWTPDRAEAFIDGLSDEQMMGIPPGLRDQFIAKLQGRT